MATSTSIPSSIAPKKIQLIGVPLDLGQARRGVDMGPSAVRVAGLEARLESLFEPDESSPESRVPTVP